MEIPNFKTQEEADTFLIKTFEEIIENVEQAQSHKEKEKILKEFDMTRLNPEEQSMGVKKIKDDKNYQKIKKDLYELFEWIEKERKVNVFNLVYKNKFLIKNQNFKFPLILNLINNFLQTTKLDVKIFLLLNIFRMVYELNLKNLIVILDNILKDSKRPIKKFYDFEDIYNEFRAYPHINIIKSYFANDIRNPIAHEDWLLENNQIVIKDKVERIFSMEELSLQIYELFFFRVALQSYIIEKFDKWEKPFTPQQINSLLDGFKKKIEEIKKKK